MIEHMKEAVCQANLELVMNRLVVMTWGNVSAIDRSRGIVVIKPSGVPYERMTPDQMVVVDLDGRLLQDGLRPSSDLPTHLALYKAWPEIGGIVHTHSACATAFAQACREVPVLGTTHADHFFGPVPVTRMLTPAEVEEEYELSTGHVIVERFRDLSPAAVPGVLAAGHGPFTWGPDARAAVKNSIALEEVARIALMTMQLAPQVKPLPDYILQKHFFRKHGPGATYGQKVTV